MPAVEDWFTSVLASGEIDNSRDKARQVMLLLEGCMALILIHGDTEYAAQAALAAKRGIES